jgi:hypothetical protein
MPLLAAIGTLIAGFVVGVILITAGHTLLGIVLAFAAIPLALIAWVMVGDRI